MSNFLNWLHHAFKPHSATHSATHAVDDVGLPALVYRLKAWPDLPMHYRTADVFRTLSRMSGNTVRLEWIAEQSKLNRAHAEIFVKYLIEHEALEVIDIQHFEPFAASPAKDQITVIAPASASMDS